MKSSMLELAKAKAKARAAKKPVKKKGFFSRLWDNMGGDGPGLDLDLFYGDESGYHFGRHGTRLKMTKKAIAARRAYRLKKSPRRSRRSSPKLRKISQKTAHAHAKRAMKLHHSKGISLKQAWRIVLKKNKFGDSVCGKGYEVNRNWSRSKGQKQCLKECDFYETRDQSTNRCKKMTMVNSTRGDGLRYRPPRAAPPRGYEINPETGRQRKICPRGYYRDPDTGRCRKIQSSLKPLRVNSRRREEDLDALDSVNFGWKKTDKNIQHRMQYGRNCFGAVPCDCGM